PSLACDVSLGWRHALPTRRSCDLCLSDPSIAQEVQADMIDGQFNGVTGTPGFLINGVLIRGAQPYPVFEKVIERELNRLGVTRTDRKSTRLNSSHVKISYAVFCLK